MASVSNLAIWGNHSATQFPDFGHALIEGKPAPEVIQDTAWLQGEFITTVQKRGASVIDARGLSSAASAANAVIDSVNAIRNGTQGDDFTSLAVVSNGEYGVPLGLQFGFPVRTSANGGWAVVEGLAHDGFATERIRITTEELEAERAEVTDLLP